jgi:phosphatidylglycerol---prolipoprotein diacylglyceryl transferase
MRRVLFVWRGIRIWSYPALLYLGLLAGVVAGNVAAHAARIDAFRTFVATLILIVLCLVGARLLYVALNWRVYRNDFARIWDRDEGGLAMLGALPLAIPMSVPLLAALGLPYGPFWDVAAFTILVGMVPTRVGCLLNGCCSGRPSDSWFAVNLPDDRGVWRRRIPMQCLEAALAVILLAVAATAWKLAPFPGAVFLGVMGGYALGRLCLESMREPSGPGRITSGHVISGLMIVCSTLALAVLWPR